MIGLLAVTPLLASTTAACTNMDERRQQSGEAKGRSTESGETTFEDLESRYGARIGVFAMDTSTGASVTHRPDERFAFCSTFKSLAAAAVLRRRTVAHLDTPVRVTAADVTSISPVTQNAIGSTMTMAQLCDAAVRFSDGTAGNLLLRDIGGPAAFTAYLRSLGDPTSRLDDEEPALNDVPPGDDRDTTTPRALALDHRAVVLGGALPREEQAFLEDLLHRNTTGAKRIRASIPPGWSVANKTGTGNYGRANDVAVARRPGSPPLLIAILSERAGFDDPVQESVIADCASRALAALQ